MKCYHRGRWVVDRMFRNGIVGIFNAWVPNTFTLVFLQVPVGSFGSLSALCSGPLLDDQWGNGCPSESVIDGTKVEIRYNCSVLISCRFRRLVRIPYVEQEPQRPYHQLRENFHKAIGMKAK